MDKKDSLKMVEQWKKSSSLLSRIRRDEMKQIDIARVIEGLDDAFEAAILNNSIRKTSGLIEMQHWFSKMMK